MTDTYTTSATFTLTHAKYLASKVAADLLQMQLFYGKPSDESINQYLEELVILFMGGYVESVDYGFRKDNDWVTVASYVIRNGSISTTDDRSGSIYSGADVSGAAWGSFLRYSSSYHNLTQSEKDRVRASLPISRGEEGEPGFMPGKWVLEKNYYNGGVSIERKVFQPY